MSRFGLLVELRNISPAQTTINNFNSVCPMDDQYLACNENGIYRIMHCEDADGTNIDAHFELMRSDLGYANPKRLDRFWIGYEASGTLKLTITVDEQVTRYFYLPPIYKDQSQHMNEVNMDRDLKGVYWDFKIENLDGCDFSVDQIIVAINVLPLASPGARIWS